MHGFTGAGIFAKVLSVCGRSRSYALELVFEAGRELEDIGIGASIF